MTGATALQQCISRCCHCDWADGGWVQASHLQCGDVDDETASCSKRCKPHGDEAPTNTLSSQLTRPTTSHIPYLISHVQVLCDDAHTRMLFLLQLNGKVGKVGKVDHPPAASVTPVTSCNYTAPLLEHVLENAASLGRQHGNRGWRCGALGRGRPSDAARARTVVKIMMSDSFSFSFSFSFQTDMFTRHWPDIVDACLD